MPVGVAVLTPAPAVFVTLAVNVTDCPKNDGFTEEVTVVEVGAQSGAADAVFEGTLSLPSDSKAVTKYVYVGPHVTLLSV